MRGVHGSRIWDVIAEMFAKARTVTGRWVGGQRGRGRGIADSGDNTLKCKTRLFPLFFDPLGLPVFMLFRDSRTGYFPSDISSSYVTRSWRIKWSRTEHVLVIDAEYDSGRCWLHSIYLIIVYLYFICFALIRVWCIDKWTYRRHGIEYDVDAFRKTRTESRLKHCTVNVRYECARVIFLVIRQQKVWISM
jgi:hypothetical protein